VRTITRYARTVRDPNLTLAELDEAVARAFGEGGEPGPSYIDFPVDTLRRLVPKPVQLEEHLRPKPRPVTRPDPARIAKAVDLLWSARRVLVISGRGARGAGPELVALLDRLGAVYLDTGESRGLVPDTHPAVVDAMRGAVMGDADVVLTVGRRLDFQLAYGSPAVFGQAQFVRIADVPAELRDNRRGTVEVLASPAEALRALVEAAGNRSASVDRAWAKGLRAGHEERARKLRHAMATAPLGSDGRLHPNRVIAALQDAMGPEAIVITDGGDFLSFARIGLSAPAMLDPGSFGCIGVDVPYGIAASLAFPDRPVVVATGDGAFGFNAIEVDTAVRHNAPVLIVVANNGAWQIEVHDQTVTYGKVVGTRLQFSDHAAMARAFGMHAERVETEEQLKPAIERPPGAPRRRRHAGGRVVGREDRAGLGARPAAAGCLGQRRAGLARQPLRQGSLAGPSGLHRQFEAHRGGDQRSIGPLSGPERVHGLRRADVVGKAELHCLGAVGDRAAECADQVGISGMRRVGGCCDSTARRMRRHLVRRHLAEQAGIVAAEGNTDFLDLVPTTRPGFMRGLLQKTCWLAWPQSPCSADVGDQIDRVSPLLLGADETFRCPFGWIDENDVLGITPGCVHRKEHNGLLQQVRQGVHDAALEEQQIAGPELSLVAGVLHPESPAAREHVEMLVAVHVIVGRRAAVDPKYAGAGRLAVGQIMVHEQRVSRLGQGGGDGAQVEAREVRSGGALIHGDFSHNSSLPRSHSGLARSMSRRAGAAFRGCPAAPSARSACRP